MTYLEQFEALCLRNAERAAAICRIEAEDREDVRRTARAMAAAAAVATGLPWEDTTGWAGIGLGARVEEPRSRVGILVGLRVASERTRLSFGAYVPRAGCPCHGRCRSCRPYAEHLFKTPEAALAEVGRLIEQFRASLGDER